MAIEEDFFEDLLPEWRELGWQMIMQQARTLVNRRSSESSSSHIGCPRLRGRFSMLRILVDTCVWLDLARDYRHESLITAAQQLFEAREIDLIVPDIVREEFARNKQRVAEDAQRSLQSHFRLVREAVSRFAEEEYRTETLRSLNEVDQRIAMKGEAINDSIEWIERLLKAGLRKPITKAIKEKVTSRALAGLAPYHRAKNSVGDAVIIETYAQIVRSTANKKDRFAFVTHNTRDFSDPNGDQRKPHLDFVDIFDGDRSTYWTSLLDLFKQEHEDWLEDIDAEFNWIQEPRRLSEILEAARLLERQVWYNRHWNLRVAIDEGDARIVTKEEWDATGTGNCNDLITEGTWKAALESARRTEEEVGIENLGPWTDFEWGMLNGKLSALRWIMGEEWD
ncbi:PIN domain-containing protein [Rhizobium laguerreae]|uniref:PIN domain-containing protein n=1 Tax=Rhizobium laguerreae TaxID=1076926 RepID=UPI001FE0BE40|nr:PIN domain-containing protein [Rhizobium laguerreae]